MQLLMVVRPRAGRGLDGAATLPAPARPARPCVHLDRLSSPGLLRLLINRGGLRADVATDGRIRLGVPVRSV